jgi:hypothetical protein
MYVWDLIMTLVQYNPSTGKASYDPLTGKVEIFNPLECQFCQETVNRASVTFTGIISRDGCYDDTSSSDFTWENVPDYNQTYILKPSKDFACRWVLSIPLSPGPKLTIWNSNDGSCSGGIFSVREYGSLDVIMLRFAPVVAVILQLGDGPDDFFRKVFDSVDGFTPTSKCVEGSGPQNDNTSSDRTSGYDGTYTTLEV